MRDQKLKKLKKIAISIESLSSKDQIDSVVDRFYDKELYQQLTPVLDSIINNRRAIIPAYDYWDERCVTSAVSLISTLATQTVINFKSSIEDIMFEREVLR